MKTEPFPFCGGSAKLIVSRNDATVCIGLIKEKLEHYKNLKTYTDCEEYRREGAIGVLEDILEDVEQE